MEDRGTGPCRAPDVDSKDHKEGSVAGAEQAEGRGFTQPAFTRKWGPWRSGVRKDRVCVISAKNPGRCLPGQSRLSRRAKLEAGRPVRGLLQQCSGKMMAVWSAVVETGWCRSPDIFRRQNQPQMNAMLFLILTLWATETSRFCPWSPSDGTQSLLHGQPANSS